MSEREVLEQIAGLAYEGTKAMFARRRGGFGALYCIEGLANETLARLRYVEAEQDAKWEAALSVLRPTERDAVLAAVKR